MTKETELILIFFSGCLIGGYLIHQIISLIIMLKPEIKELIEYFQEMHEKRKEKKKIKKLKKLAYDKRKRK